MNVLSTSSTTVKYMPISEGIVWIDGQQSTWKGTIKSVCGDLQVPSIILLVFCLTAPDKSRGLALYYAHWSRDREREGEAAKKGTEEKTRAEESERKTKLPY